MSEQTNPEIVVQSQEKLRETTSQQMDLDSALSGLVKYGGFDIIDATVEKAGNLNPAKKAKKNIYLNESELSDRKTLKKRLQMWIDLLSNHKDVAAMMNHCDEKSDAASNLLAQNIAIGLEATKELEQSYRGVDLFLKNTGKDQVPNISFMNAPMENIQDLDNPIYSTHVQEELNINYNRLDLRNAYSLMVLPGYLGKNSVINHWAKIASDHKVTMVTDFRDLEDASDVIEMFKEADHSSADEYKSNVIMACNWLVGRGGYPELGIDDMLHVPPSTALAGKIYESKSSMSQIAAGLQHGKLQGVDGVAFPTKKTELTQLEGIGLVPVTNEFGSVMAFSGKTLFNGDNVGLQNYSVVRTFDWVTKVLIDFLNRSAFENFNSTVQKNLQQKIAKFLESIRGSGKLIKDFSIHELEQDKNNPNMVNVKINITPFFATKTFLLSMAGTNGDDGVNWDTDVK
jgi:hypothetical protein